MRLSSELLLRLHPKLSLVYMDVGVFILTLLLCLRFLEEKQFGHEIGLALSLAGALVFDVGVKLIP